MQDTFTVDNCDIYTAIQQLMDELLANKPLGCAAAQDCDDLPSCCDVSAKDLEKPHPTIVVAKSRDDVQATVGCLVPIGPC
jgi:hypothetical protein